MNPNETGTANPYEASALEMDALHAFIRSFDNLSVALSAFEKLFKSSHIEDCDEEGFLELVFQGDDEAVAALQAYKDAFETENDAGIGIANLAAGLFGKFGDGLDLDRGLAECSPFIEVSARLALLGKPAPTLFSRAVFAYGVFCGNLAVESSDIDSTAIFKEIARRARAGRNIPASASWICSNKTEFGAIQAFEVEFDSHAEAVSAMNLLMGWD